MTHALHRVVGFRIVGPHSLSVAFEDGTEQAIDFLPVLKGPMFGALKDECVFGSVALDEEAGTLVWPNGADFDPATLHDWPALRDELITRAASWV